MTVSLMSSQSIGVDNLMFSDFPMVTDRVLIASGQNLTRGSVLGRITQSVPTTGTAGSNTGNGTVSGVTGGNKTKIGTYTILCEVAITHGGTFLVTDPGGKNIGSVTILAGAGQTGVFKSDEINFTVTDGSTDFAIADDFTIEVASGIPATGTADGGNTGNGTMTAVVGNRDAKVGVYTVKCITKVTNAGVFSVEDPDGIALPDSTVAEAYVHDQISFLLNDGGTDFEVDDEFTVTVTIGKDHCKLVDSTNTDGSGAPRFVLLKDTDATSAAIEAIAAWTGDFNERELVFGGSDTIETHRDALRELSIFSHASQPR